MDLLKLNSNNNILVSISNIIKTKYKIPKQYENTNIGGNTKYLHNLSNKNDRYLLHIFEEMSEFTEECKKSYLKKQHLNNNYDCKEELIDVIAYISSLLSIMYIERYGEKFILSQEFNKEIYIGRPYIKYNEIEEIIINDTLIEVQRILISERRNFPERKWHKDVDRNLSIEELKDLYDDNIFKLQEALIKTICLFLKINKCDVEEFNKIFIEKNERIFNLKK